MSYELVVPMSRPWEVWSASAVEGLVGQRPVVNGSPGEVLEAWRDHQGTVQARLRVEGEPPDLSGVRGFPIGLAVPADTDGGLGEGVAR